MSVLQSPHLETLLDGLHAKSEAQLEGIEQYIRANIRKISPTKAEDFRRYRSDKLLAIDKAKGEFCYQMCRAIGAKTVVEIGTSYGVSTIYLATAVCDNGGGKVISTEIEPCKIAAAQQNFREAGLTHFVEVWEGDFRQTLTKLSEPVDLVLIDAWIDAPVDAIELLDPWLEQRAVVLCDDMLTNRNGKAYIASLEAKGFLTTTLPFRDGLALSVRH